MKELDKTYNPSEIEGRIYDKWMEKKYFHAEVNRDKKPFTIVMPPPNITGRPMRQRINHLAAPPSTL